MWLYPIYNTMLGITEEVTEHPVINGKNLTPQRGSCGVSKHKISCSKDKLKYTLSFIKTSVGSLCTGGSCMLLVQQNWLCILALPYGQMRFSHMMMFNRERCGPQTQSWNCILAYWQPCSRETDSHQQSLKSLSSLFGQVRSYFGCLHLCCYTQ